jgi:hypothetical protein
MKIRNNLGSFYSVLGGNNSIDNLPPNVGRVFHVIMDPKSAGYNNSSDIGTVYILKNNSPKPNIDFLNTNPTKEELIASGLKSAKPLFPHIGYIPLNEELVLLFDLPSYNSDVISGASQTYYITSINLYNNPHHNSQAVYNIVDSTKNNIKLGNYIDELPVINPLLPFEGDVILNSRWGAGLRFTSTFKFNEGENFWSYTGKTGDPLTLLVNGYKFPTDSTDPYVENINSDAASLYLTSTQVISNFEPKFILSNNPFNSVVNPSKYGGYSQAVLSSNRIVLSSNKDDINFYASTNIEMGANNTIHLNSKNIYLNSPKIFLGQIKNQSLGTDNTELPQPIMLGDNTQLFLSKLLNILNKFTSNLTLLKSAKSGQEKLLISTFASSTQKSLELLRKDLGNILSTTTFVSK